MHNNYTEFHSYKYHKYEFIVAHACVCCMTVLR